VRRYYNFYERSTKLKNGIKILLILVAVGAIAGLVIAYICKNKCGCDEDEDFFDEDDDFDLDEDLKATEREYVNLKKDAEEVVDKVKDVVADKVDKAKDKAKDVVDDIKDALD